MKTKIASLITLIAVAVIAVTVLTLYFVPVNYMPALANPNSIVVCQTSNKSATLVEGDEAYGKVVGEVTKSFQQSLLSAIFAGQTGSAFNQSSSGELITTTTEPTLTTYVQYDYNDGQKIVVNGHKQNVEINQVIIKLENTTGYSTVKVYFKQVSATAEQTTYYTMDTLATQSELYKLVQSMQIV